MADPRAFDNPVGIEQGEALTALVGLLEDVPDAGVTFSERHGNDYLIGSPVTLAEAARDDHQVRQAHGTNIMVSELVRVVAHQQEEIEQLRAEATAKPKATTKR